MHYYSHHVGDYHRDTAHLSILEHGVYRLLMDSYYSTERALPADVPILCRIVRAVSKAEREAVANVAKLFFIECDGALKHNRIERELESYNTKIQQASEAGRASAAKRQSVTNSQRPFNDRSTTVEIPLERKGNEHGNGTATIHDPITMIHDPITKEDKKPKPVQSPAALDEFAQFWQAYPKKQGKEPARKAWMRDKPDLQKVLKALEWQKSDEQWTKEAGQYIPLPASYLNAKRYDDESSSASEMEPEHVYLDKMTPEERMTHFRNGYPESDWPFIMEDGYLDLLAKGLASKAAKEAERRAAEGPSPETTEGEPGLW